MIRHYLDKIIEKGDKAQMEELSDIMGTLFDEIEKTNIDKYNDLKLKLYEMANGEMLNNDMAHTWVVGMKPHGEHWNMATTSEVMKQKGLNYSDIDFYVVMNMIYNDYFNAVGDNDEMYINLANEWLSDVDACQNKVFKYWKYISRKEDK